MTNNGTNSRNTAQTQTLLTKTYHILHAAKLYSAWESANAMRQTFGVNPARSALVSSTYGAYIAYMDANDWLYGCQDSIKRSAEVQ